MPEVEARRGGVRDLLGHPTVRRLLADGRFRDCLRRFVDEDLVAIKATLFDKTPASNWRVQWHQDRGTERTLAVRIHLDECGADNGPLRVIPGTHKRGKLTDDEILEVIASAPAIAELHAPQGSILVMRPLLVHASLPARAPAHRRVLHIELAPTQSTMTIG